MWPPQSVKTWPTPACLRTRATSRPPVRSAMASGAMEKREHLGREALDLLALLGGGTDRIQGDVVAARRAPALPGGPEGAAGPPAELDGRAGLLHRLGIERDAAQLRDPPLERRGRVAPERAHALERLAHARAPLAVRHAADLELLRIL